MNNDLKALNAIQRIANATNENEVLDAKAVHDEVDWSNKEELKDQWNDLFGDAQKYLP